MYALVVARPTLCAPTTTHRSLSLSRASAPPLLKHSVIRAPLHPARASPPCTRPPPLPLHSTTPSAPAPHSCTCLSINLDPSTSARRSRRRPTARERVRTRGTYTVVRRLTVRSCTTFFRAPRVAPTHTPRRAYNVRIRRTDNGHGHTNGWRHRQAAGCIDCQRSTAISSGLFRCQLCSAASTVSGQVRREYTVHGAMSRCCGRGVVANE
mmetsp:Transcript_3636/g.12025  ORF Transcript_3636/g.12025 Transcript_3636/m.12025 type:complete len:210 (-) Transcript_3636:125-754(-)